ncbi:hypothetical protein C4B68_08395 [Streptomyces dengpaensis]|uniref:Head-tail adaptor protein n=2 Tax=Streptomyces TaxID=1883 RepID=A0ABM6SMT0_9ACTN|nr:hypothetical protein C4B68_08395 [Streptomyces dengpaensis]PIB12040.1 hypothetical protein B1C81_02330 [Streptomyces sp. HG99]
MGMPARVRSRRSDEGRDRSSSPDDPRDRAARLVIRTVTDATVYGTRVNWRLRLATDDAREGDPWATLRTLTTTW